MDPNYTMLFPWNSLQANVGKSLYLTSREKKDYESSEEAIIAVLPGTSDRGRWEAEPIKPTTKSVTVFFFYSFPSNFHLCNPVNFYLT
jgi:hypothetical protein